MDDLFYDLEKDKFSSKCKKASNGECLIWTGPKTSDKNYGLVSFIHPSTGQRTKKKAHRFAMTLDRRYLNLDSSMDSSHLCHNNFCVNTAHISLEPHDINNNRIHCRNVGHVFGHEGYKDCLLYLQME